MMAKVEKLMSFSCFSRHTAFSDILRNSTPNQHSSGDQAIPIIYDDANIGSWQDMHVEASNLLTGHELQHDIGNHQDMIFGDQVAFEVRELQTEANDMLNPDWTLSLDEFAVAQSTEANIGTNDFHDSITPSQRVDWDHQTSAVQQDSYNYLQITGPECSDIPGSTLEPVHNAAAPSQAHSSGSQGFESENNNALSDLMKPLCSPPVPIAGELPKRASKRKRIKTALSRKKPCLTPLNALRNDLSSKLTLRTEATEACTTNDKVSSKQLNHGYPTGHQGVGCIPAWEQGSNGRNNFDSAGIVRDIKISDSERRPMSWPHRNPWRKSLDISVAVLTKGFEKLMTERGESSLPSF